MFEKFSNSWKLFKAAASVLAADRELLNFSDHLDDWSDHYQPDIRCTHVPIQFF